MKKILIIFLTLTLLAPIAVMACHCCPGMSAPAVLSEVSLSGVQSMSCCYMMAQVKECAPKIERFLQVSQEFLKAISALAQSEMVSVFTMPSVTRERGSPGEPDFLSAQPPRYLSLSVLRV